MFHRYLKLGISTAKLNVFLSKCEYSLLLYFKFLSKHIFMYPVIQVEKSWRNWYLPASLLLTNPFSHRVLSTLLLKCLLSSCLLPCPHSYYCSFRLDPHLLYRLVSLVFLSSLNWVFSICHQSYVWKNNQIWQRFTGCHVTGHRQGCSELPVLLILYHTLQWQSFFSFSFAVAWPFPVICDLSLCLLFCILFAWTSFLLLFTLTKILKHSSKPSFNSISVKVSLTHLSKTNYSLPFACIYFFIQPL